MYLNDAWTRVSSVLPNTPPLPTFPTHHVPTIEREAAPVKASQGNGSGVVSPRHLAQVARVQAVSRKAQTGASLADIAADVGFADQPPMSRVVRQLTGLTA